jgi:hypothetical protein
MCRVHGLARCECGYARGFIALGLLGVVLTACGLRPDVCSERDAALVVNEASCLAQVKARCAGVPLDEPCTFEEECKAFTRGRCR